ncbi:cyanophycin synthetase [Paraburkholderia sp. RL17-337-BIB-A]|uniref:cyanophycin synthetase n=1 Tax=Paraburkholderia sp. RL17-337-BIB-A TaxID=3031636 RepID=UPI0038BDD17A
MEVKSIVAYQGPSIHAHFPVIRYTVDLGVLEEWPTGRLGQRFIDSFLGYLPGLAQHGCSYQSPGGLVRRMTEGEGTWLGHVMEHVAIELQKMAGSDVSFGRTRSAGPHGHYDVIYEYHNEAVGRLAGDLALALIEHLLPAELKPQTDPGTQFDFEQKLDDFLRDARRHEVGPSTAALMKAAADRAIPCTRMNADSLIRLGYGRFQKRIKATLTSETRQLAVDIASDKEETNRTLRDAGLPVPHQRKVYRACDAVVSAEQLGYPVVVKPLDCNHGKGVSIKLTTPEQVELAYKRARKYSHAVLVESYIPGSDYRMLVVNDQLVAVARRVPAHVVGDGLHTVEQLVEEANRDSRRGAGHENVLTRIELGDTAQSVLGAAGYDVKTVPVAGESVYLCATANLSTGGTSIDVTDQVHPDNREMAVRAVKAIGLDVAGVDFITTDIAASYREVGGAMCEVNASPGLRMHLAPSEGAARDVAGAIVDMLYPSGTPKTIPIASITGTNGKTTTSRMLAQIMKLAGYTVGLGTTDGVYIDGRMTRAGDMTGVSSARMILADCAVDAAVLETARGGLLRRGLGYPECNVAACLNVSADHLGLSGIETVEQMAEVKRIIIEVARDMAVLNADDPLCMKMADHTEASRLCYVTMHAAHPLVGEHIRAGGAALVLEEQVGGHLIVLWDGGRRVPLLWTYLIPATVQGLALHNVQNAMFAAALARGLGIDVESIQLGLRTFDNSFSRTPGRMNICDDHPFRVILDYAHNPAAVQTMCALVERLGADQRKIVSLTVPGDRRDEDIQAIGRIAAGHFDQYICHRDSDSRGRDHLEVPDMLCEALRTAGVPQQQIKVVAEEQTANQLALEMARPGDLLLLLSEDYAGAWEQIGQFKPEMPRAQATTRKPIQMRIRPADLGGFEWTRDMEIVRDARGVRLARELED